MGETVTSDRIIEAADWLFCERGYEHTSFADVAERVKRSRGNFYHHFKPKAEILEVTPSESDARLGFLRSES
jgi:TetR/AcrR family transcriptional regulator, transcriptional repressor for nem operon